MPSEAVNLNNPYENPGLLSQYLLFHYGSDQQNLPWGNGPKEALRFAQRCADEGIDSKLIPAGANSALDIGCAVGGSSFALARRFTRVVGIDYSHQFIRAANSLKEQGALEFSFTESGEQQSTAHIEVPVETRRRVRFLQGDAHELDPGLGSFDAVLCCNLLCRLREPRKLLQRLPELVKPGGQLFITTPETWLEEYTPRENWLSGRHGEPELIKALERELGTGFELVKVWEMPFLIREHRRKYQWSVAQASRWKRR